MKYYLNLLFVFVVSFPATALAEKGFVRGEPLTASEISALEPVCKLILIDNYNVHLTWISQKQNSALFDRPEYRMAKNAYFLHHRCGATVERHRYFNARSSQEKQKYMSGFHDEMNYVIRNMAPDWEYGPLMHVENGDMYFWGKQFADVLSESFKALQQNPDYAPAYVLMAKAYDALKNKEQSLAAATEGLKHNPGSRALKRLYEEAGGKLPYPEPYPRPEQVSSDTKVHAIPASAPTAEKESPLPVSNGAPSENTSKPTNPYCRFCP